MSIFSNNVKFSFDVLDSTVDDPRQSWQILLGIAATFSISVEDGTFYSEIEFPIVEFAQQAIAWLQVDEDFLYISTESEEEPLIGFYRQGHDLFEIYSPHQILPPTSTRRDSLDQAIREMVGTLIMQVQSRFGIDIAGVLRR
jgi:hypothetical protein